MNLICNYVFGDYTFIITTISPMGQWVNSSPPSAAYIYASMNWVSIGSDNGLSPDRRQAITWTNAD